ncbi:glycosyltransferase involved in cell wall biosynthesis [Mucilaginibacter lappiensis]|uniref:Glycosyltransferase involved in cell wall biosynthesis n=1 Tax=Mucilaginibacter lappiensis TaxID=354630 RepID=A0ABR6PMA3_9SPHI|nr:glycosyltransferase family 2 protein [Mucilaginibacter lappiensis]MBB6110899.1 glycosyltransferase involved in cell wall biosynthesis [Mucilaginibacter lappiensis]
MRVYIFVFFSNLYVLKLSLVTVVYNAQDTIKQCIQSVISQNYPNLEYIIIDGGSTDHTLQIINEYREYIQILVSEPDKGIYDAMNKGIRLATGDIVGMLNADDHFADERVLHSIAGVFTQHDVEALYGDLDIVDQRQQVIRKWRSGKCNHNSFKLGFMPPHPTFYCRRSLFDQFGFYSLDHGSAADYELMLRLMYRHQIRSYHLKMVMVNMSAGGISSKNLKNRVKAWQFDLLAMRQNKIPFPVLTLALKPLRKIVQFL